MNRRRLIVAAAAILGFQVCHAPAIAITTPVLGTAQDFAVLGHTTVTNTGSSVIFGGADVLANVGVFSAGGANATTGFSTAGNTFVGPGSNTDGPGQVVAPAVIHLGSPAADLARNDLIAAYTALASYGTAVDLSGQILGNGVGGVVPTLGPGVYSFASTAQLNGTMELDAGGIDGGVWVFQIGTDLTTASASAVRLVNPGGNLGSDVGVFWVLGTSDTPGLGSATLGTTTSFEGNILALTSITLNTGATIYNGRALARNGAVTLDTNVISDICPPESSSPNAGPGFSSGLGFDTITHELVLIGPAGTDEGNGNGNGNGNGTGPGGPNVTAIPEPATSALVGCGLAAVLLSGCRRLPGQTRNRRLCR